MSIQQDTTTRGDQLTQLNDNIGDSAVIDIYTGSPPANCAATATGTLLATLTGNSSGFGSISGSTLTVNSVTGADAVATGTAGYFRVYDSGGTTCHLQGTVAESGGDLNITNTAINENDPISISSWTITAPP